MSRFLLTVSAVLFAAGCGSGPDPEVAMLRAEIKALTTTNAALDERVATIEKNSQALAAIPELISTLAPLADELRAGRPLPETLKLRDLQIIDENGETRIHLHADAGGSQVWLADHRQKRILLTAWQPDARLGDLSGVVFQTNGAMPTWQTPKVQ